MATTGRFCHPAHIMIKRHIADDGSNKNNLTYSEVRDCRIMVTVVPGRDDNPSSPPGETGSPLFAVDRFRPALAVVRMGHPSITYAGVYFNTSTTQALGRDPPASISFGETLFRAPVTCNNT